MAVGARDLGALFALHTTVFLDDDDDDDEDDLDALRGSDQKHTRHPNAISDSEITKTPSLRIYGPSNLSTSSPSVHPCAIPNSGNHLSVSALSLAAPGGESANPIYPACLSAEPKPVATVPISFLYDSAARTHLPDQPPPPLNPTLHSPDKHPPPVHAPRDL